MLWSKDRIFLVPSEPAEETDLGEERNHTLLPSTEAVFLGWSTQRRIFVQTHPCQTILSNKGARTEEQGAVRWRYFTHGVQAWMCIRKPFGSVCRSGKPMASLRKSFAPIKQRPRKYWHWQIGSQDKIVRMSPWKEQGSIGNLSITCSKGILNSWWSMLSISKRFQEERPTQKTLRGLQICCNMGCSKPRSFLQPLKENYGN